MMKPIIDQIQITVKDLTVAEEFYDKFLAVLGFDLSRKAKGRVPEHDFDVVEYYHPLLIFGINSPREAFKDETIHRRKPGALHHLAFKAESCAEVDCLYPKIKEAGATIVKEPCFYPQHGAYYYALFFKDPAGIKYEIVYERREEG